MKYFKNDEEFKDYETMYKDILKSNSREIELKKGKNTPEDKDIVKRYKKYQEIIGKIIKCAAKKENDGIEVSRNGFDHLLWYYYKGKI
jgi:hypothetical protein